jgi:hypothetical protein
VFLLCIVREGAQKQGKDHRELLCRACHDALEDDLIAKNISGWDHLSKALVLALGQLGYDEGEIRRSTEDYRDY